MRRSCRLSTKHEHRLLKQAEAVAADAAAAEAAEEAGAVYPSTVTKAIAGLATPSLPSPSMFPDDWRMVHEYLNDGQVPHLAKLDSLHVLQACGCSCRLPMPHMCVTNMLVLVTRIELLLAMQSTDGQTQPLCPTQLFQDIESECGPVGGLDGIEPLLAPSGAPT